MTEGLVAFSPEDRLRQAFAAYNRQDTDALLAMLSDDVRWVTDLNPLHGKQELRSYWDRQWRRSQTHDQVLEIVRLSESRYAVELEQVVRSVDGDVLSTGRLSYVFVLRSGLIEALLSITSLEVR